MADELDRYPHPLPELLRQHEREHARRQANHHNGDHHEVGRSGGAVGGLPGPETMRVGTEDSYSVQSDVTPGQRGCVPQPSPNSEVTE